MLEHHTLYTFTGPIYFIKAGGIIIMTTTSKKDADAFCKGAEVSYYVKCANCTDPVDNNNFSTGNYLFCREECKEEWDENLAVNSEPLI